MRTREYKWSQSIAKSQMCSFLEALLSFSFNSNKVCLSSSFYPKPIPRKNHQVSFLNPHPRMFIDFRERERDTKGGRDGKEKEKHRSAASRNHPDRASNPQPRSVPWLGIEPTTFWVWDDSPTNWATQPGPTRLYFQYWTLSRPPNQSWQDKWGAEHLMERQPMQRLTKILKLVVVDRKVGWAN